MSLLPRPLGPDPRIHGEEARCVSWRVLGLEEAKKCSEDPSHGNALVDFVLFSRSYFSTSVLCSDCFALNLLLHRPVAMAVEDQFILA